MDKKGKNYSHIGYNMTVFYYLSHANKKVLI